MEVKVPQFGAGGFKPAGEYGFYLGVKNGERRLGERYCAVGVAESADNDHGVLEGR